MRGLVRAGTLSLVAMHPGQLRREITLQVAPPSCAAAERAERSVRAAGARARVATGALVWTSYRGRHSRSDPAQAAFAALSISLIPCVNSARRLAFEVRG